MIINCICGKKKFRLSDELMPAEGSKVRCGACSEVWFFHPTQGNQAEIDQETDKTYDNQISSEATESQDQTYETPVEEFSETTEIVEDEVSTDNQNKNLTSFKIFTDEDDDLPSKEEMDKNLDNYKVERESNKSFFSKLFKKDRMQLAAESLEKKKNEEISEEEQKSNQARRTRLLFYLLILLFIVFSIMIVPLKEDVAMAFPFMKGYLEFLQPMYDYIKGPLQF